MYNALKKGKILMDLIWIPGKNISLFLKYIYSESLDKMKRSVQKQPKYYFGTLVQNLLKFSH